MNFMVNQMNKLQKNRKNKNKGFTLVELIIVIAIIAILAAVLAPQYIQYVEKSRVGTDQNALNEIAHAAEIAVVGDGVTQPTSTDFDVTIASGVATYESNDLSAKVAEVVPANSYKFTSNTYKNKTVNVKVTNGVGSWT